MRNSRTNLKRGQAGFLKYEQVENSLPLFAFLGNLKSRRAEGK
jgi:hypothetical protein